MTVQKKMGIGTMLNEFHKETFLLQPDVSNYKKWAMLKYFFYHT